MRQGYVLSRHGESGQGCVWGLVHAIDPDNDDTHRCNEPISLHTICLVADPLADGRRWIRAGQTLQRILCCEC